MPAMFVRWISGKFGYMSRKFSIEIYAILKPIFLYFVLFSGRANNKWWVLLTLWLFADLYLYLFGLVFLRRFYTVPASYGRSLLLLGINFCEAALAFAIFYTFSHSLFSNGHVVYAPIDMLYFSLVTASTVGFGDITVSSDTAKWLVIGQILSSLGFISLFVASFVAGFNDSEHA